MPGRFRGARALVLALMVAGCSSPPSAPSPSVTFGSGATTPGMPGMSAMPNMPAGEHAFDHSAGGSGGRQRGQHRQLRIRPGDTDRPAGSTVTWTNRDEEPHTVVANDGSFHSPGMGSQATFSYTFAKAGTFDYVCSIHPFMHATVVVTP